MGGVNLMAEELNRSGGLLGYKVIVVPMDDESDSDIAIGVAEQIRTDIAGGKRVLGLIGHYNSGQTLAAMEIYKDLPLVIITPTASELSITQRGYSNFFRVNANDAIQANVDAKFLVEQLLSTVPKREDTLWIDDMGFRVRDLRLRNGFQGSMWTNGIVYYAFDPAVSSASRSRWKAAAAVWSTAARS